MENYYVLKTRLLQNIWKLQHAIDDELDWFIASLTEKDQKRRELARTIHLEKQRKREQIAKEAHEQFK